MFSIGRLGVENGASKEYLAADDELGFAKYHDTGTIWIPNQVHGYKHILELYEQVGVEYEIWDGKKLTEKMPLFTTKSNWPPRRPEMEQPDALEVCRQGTMPGA